MAKGKGKGAAPAETEAATATEEQTTPAEAPADDAAETETTAEGAAPADGAADDESPPPDAPGPLGADGEAPVAEAAPPEPPAEPPKRSPAEAFTDLADAVHLVRADVDEVAGFVRTCREKLFRQADEYRYEGMAPTIEAMMRIHSLVFRQVMAMQAGGVRPDGFTLNLFESIEAEFRGLGIEVIHPQPGDDVNLDVMTTVKSVPKAFWRPEGTVAHTLSCGFVLKGTVAVRVLRKAEVAVHRKRSDLAE